MKAIQISRSGIYSGATVALGSMHHKQAAIAKPFVLRLGLTVHVPRGLDTDCYGTFTGEVERYGTMFEAACAKANLAIEQSGIPYGLGSEGTFGDHPYLPGVIGNTELLVFVDRARNLVVREALISRHTNYGWFCVRPGEDCGLALEHLVFPSHAVVVTPHAPFGQCAPTKGIRDRRELQRAIAISARQSFDEHARITSDMRAHMNPTRMAVIRAAGHRLARRIGSACDACGAPGFGLTDLVRGLPCAECSMPTPDAFAELHRCAVCAYERRVSFRRPRTRAAASRCPQCLAARISRKATT